ncbi:hypothetical protein [uncultured Azohydromonas sp.]|jgi:hypothetical protein|uniref:hypothetical protein n=1 Tax=uncultured Azohydromonas sp. TaxID=487342 RepID=UPI0026208209|nr:hypothetical protein [uncultured Azohydromonas sp.]
MPDLDIIGLLCAITGDTAVQLAGWHINSTAPLPGLGLYEVTPKAPQRVFAGVQTHFYRFESREQAEELLATAASLPAQQP